MAIPTPFRTTPQLGPQLNEVFTNLPYWDTQLGVGSSTTPSPSYKLGNKEVGNDGADYIWVQASAVIAATSGTGTGVTITVPAYTVATGGTTWYTPPGVAIASGQYFHARRGAYGSAPV